MEDNQGAFVFFSQFGRQQFVVDALDFISIKRLTKRLVKMNAQQVVNLLKSVLADLIYFFPEGVVLRITLLQKDQFIASGLRDFFGFLVSGASFFIEIFQIL